MITETEANMAAVHTAILRKANAAVGRELRGFYLTDRGGHKLAKFPPLFLGNGCPQVLNLGMMLSNEDDKSDVSDPGRPGIADKLWIKG
jgi:hypothetical protein